jgi:ubiquitin C-terminal hydrolase
VKLFSLIVLVWAYSAYRTCSQCKRHTHDSKQQITIGRLPYILLISFQRFDRTGKKITRCIAPSLNLAVSGVRYDLFGCVWHSGSTPITGHYEAFTRSLFGDDWLHANDVLVSEASENKSNASSASEKSYFLAYVHEGADHVAIPPVCISSPSPAPAPAPVVIVGHRVVEAMGI